MATFLEDMFGEMINKGNDKKSPESISSLLAQRFQPSTQDASESIFRSVQDDKYTAPREIAMSRMQNELTPYTSMLGLAKQAKEMRDGGTQDPSTIREWNVFSNLPPEQQARYLQMKRADRVMNLGGSQAVLSPTGGIAEQYQVTPRPEQMPQFKAEQSAAEKSARGEISDVQKKKTGQEQVSGLLEELKQNYGELSASKGITSTQNKPIQNIGAYARSSGIGQTLGAAVGTKEQSIRNKIKQSMPLLVNAIRQSTAMGARGMDSEKELEFYMNAATNPSLDVEANLAAIDRLDKAYGLSTNKNSEVNNDSGDRDLTPEELEEYNMLIGK
jgi:hypothetical protein